MGFSRFRDRVWLSSPTMHEEERYFVKEAFDTNWVSTVGENLTQLEQGICDYTGCKYSVALGAGTAAIHLAVKLAGVKQNDKVFCSDLTFAATVNPVSYEKGEQVFIDCERDTWNMDPDVLKKAFEIYDGKKCPKPKAVIVANLYGTPARLSEIQKICEKQDTVLIEDAAESLGAAYLGKQTGTFGKYNIISFNGNKIITTSGGGMFLTDEKEAADKVRFWSTQAKENFPWYQHEELGYNYRMSNILAGIGRGQLIHLNEHVAAKKAVYEKYKKDLYGLPVSMNPYIKEIMEPNFWLSCLLIGKDVAEGTSVEWKQVTPAMIREKLEAYNVESRPIWKPMHLQPLYENCDYITAEDGISVSDDIFRRGLCLPSDIKMTAEQQETVSEMIKSCFEKRP